MKVPPTISTLMERKLLILELALLTIKAPETVRAVVEEKEVMSLTTRKLLIDDDALLTLSAPTTSSAVVEALVAVNLVPSKVKPVLLVNKPLVVAYGILPEAKLLIVRPCTATSPLASRVKALTVEVAKVVGDEVAK